MRPLPLHRLALGLWVLCACGIPAVASARERWKNDFSLEMESIAGAEMGTGLSAAWFFRPVLGVGVAVTRVTGAPLGGVFAAVRWHGAGGFFLGAQTGPQLGDFARFVDDEELPRTGLFWNGALFAGFRFGSGLQAGLKWAATAPILTDDGWTLGEAPLQMLMAFFGFTFMGPRAGIAVEPQEEMSLVRRLAGEQHPLGDPAAPDSPAPHRLFSLVAGLGTGTPAGHFFVEAGFSPVRSVEMTVGFGRGSEGAAESVTLRTRSLGFLALNHIFIGTGISHETMGEKLFRQNHLENHEEFVIEDAWFYNLETGYGWIDDDGFMGRFAFGLTTLLNPSEGTCVANCTLFTADGRPVPTRETGKFARVTPYISLTMGFAF